MIFWTWRSYFMCWLFKNKVWCPVCKKRRRYFHFLLSLAYPIDRLDWALFSVVILFHHLFPLFDFEKFEIRTFIFPSNFPMVLIIFTGRGGAPPPQRGTGRGGRPFLLAFMSHWSRIIFTYFAWGKWDGHMLARVASDLWVVCKKYASSMRSVRE